MTEKIASLEDIFGSSGEDNNILSRVAALNFQVDEPAPKKKSTREKKDSPEVNPYVELWEKKNNSPAKRIYAIYAGTDIHVTSSKHRAEEISKDLDRDIQTIRSLEYMWVLKPSFRLITYGLKHGQVDIRPDGSVLIRLVMEKNTLYAPMTYTSERIIELREKFSRFAGPAMNHIASRKDLIRYILDAASIVYTVRELNLLQSILSSVFSLDMDAEVGFSYPEKPVSKSKMRMRTRKSSRLIGPTERR